MPVLYILGAGCSRNYAQSTHGIKGLRSPLNHDFFKMAKLVIENTGMKYDASFMEEIDFLIRTIAPFYGYNQSDLGFFDSSALSLEEIMTLLDIDFKLFSSRTVPSQRLRESRQLRTLKDLLVRTLDYALKGPPCSKHLALAKRMEPGDLVLNFNYDILMDNALYASRKITDSGYGLIFFRINQDEQWANPSEEPSKVNMLKLHGSLNWIRCSLCGSLLLYHYKKQTMYGAHSFQCPRCSSSESHAIRMMIPPIQSKDYGDQDISFLWVQADQMIRDFSKIVCIGYSFSAFDFDMTSLMRRYRARRTKVPEVDFVNRDYRVERHFKSLIGVENVRHFSDLTSYLESD